MNILNKYISKIAKQSKAILKTVSVNFNEHAMLILYGKKD